MGTSPKKQIIIPKEDAVFWMDKHGIWHNEHGPFEHPKIIKYFNASIQKDDQGYYVNQATGEFEEKVYFSFENTAIFVFNMIMVDEELMLILNTGDKIKLDPEKLFTYDDSLFTRTREHTIKFTEHVLIKLSKYLEEEAGEFSIKIKDRIYAIPEQNLDEC